MSSITLSHNTCPTLVTRQEDKIIKKTHPYLWRQKSHIVAMPCWLWKRIRLSLFFFILNDPSTMQNIIKSSATKQCLTLSFISFFDFIYKATDKIMTTRATKTIRHRTRDLLSPRKVAYFAFQSCESQSSSVICRFSL